jgi:ketosteroid isomerase-like protein
LNAPGEAADVIRRWFDGMARGELGVDMWAADARIENAEGWVIETEYLGHDGVRHWWHELDEAFEDLRLELDELTPIDDERFVTTQHFVGRFRTTGIEIEGPWASLMTVREGHIAHAIGYFSKADAMSAAAVAGGADG